MKSASSAWPKAVFDAPILRGLDARAAAELESAGRLIELAAGERLYGAGDRGDAFYVVARGELELSELRPGDGVRELVRRVGASDHAGAEAALALSRRHEAIASKATVAAEIPAHLFRRVTARAGRSELADALERSLRRTATLELFASAPLGKRLDPRAIDALVDAARWRELARGEAIYRRGDPSTALYVVADGFVQVQTEDEGGRQHVRAYVRRGDFFGDREIETATARRESAVASGPAAVLEIPARVVRSVMEAHGELFAELRRVGGDDPDEPVRRAAALTTQHAFRDLYRLSVARSLLVIDQDTCVRCGHCTWACGELHGTARMNRRGDKLTTRLRVLEQPGAEATAEPTGRGARAEAGFDVFRMGAAELAAPKPLLLPNSCQHCEQPACMIDCPTGAIGRDPEGEVYVRESLCTGCGACARACPWDNIHMAERAAGAPRPPGPSAELVATKCDLCRGRAEGPGCVEACPVGAIFRVDPSSDFADVAEVLGRPATAGGLVGSTRRLATRLWLAGATIAAAGIGAAGITLQARGELAPGRGPGWWAGVAAACAMAGLVGYELPKRAGLLRAAWRRRRGARAEAPRLERPPSTPLPAPRPSYVVHLALGVLAAGLVLVHAPLRPPSSDSGSVALSSFALASLSGLVAALAYALVPRRLSRIEATPLLPEDHARAAEQLERRIFRGLSGKSELVKKIAETILLPYARAPLGPLALLLAGRSLRAERVRLRRTIEAKLEGRGGDKLEGLDELVRAAVEQRALPAQRLAGAALRGVAPLHVASFVIALIGVMVHATLASGCGR